MTNSADADQLASANWSGSTLFAKTGYVVFSKRKVKQQYSELWEWISRTEIKEEFKVSKFMLAISHPVETKLSRLNISLILDFVSVLLYCTFDQFDDL